ncbi:Sec23/Sec24 trunk domain-containing protein [Flagelloscypha sp. PMI_526]|nr:Sec23/Sec24 trunk domain-containing protein [Flagelloscypha sp. PMI_526]
MAFAHGPPSPATLKKFHASHIPQPPHTTGARLPGFRTRIDPQQIPSVTEIADRDREEWLPPSVWSSQPDTRAPMATTEYSAIDHGNSTPKFIRVSSWNLPATPKLAANCRLPMVAIIQPFAEPEPCIDQEGVNRNEVPVINTGESGPMRCSTCRAYINPSVVWIDGGTKWMCNLCRGLTKVPPESFSNLDVNGLRLDQFQRPELFRGTVDFVVPKDYWASHPPQKLTMPYFSPMPLPTGPREPRPLNYVFAFDVSHESIQSGFLAAACENVPDGIEPCFPPASEVAILTFDNTLHYYDLSSDAVSMLIMPDLDEVYLPLLEGLFVNPTERRPTIETLLSTLPGRYANNLNVEAAMGSAIRGCLAALSGRGGHLIIYQSTMPTTGAGAVMGNRNEQALRETDDEKKLYVPRNDTWPVIADECASEGVGVTMFLGHAKFIDVGSIGCVSTLTGGDIFFHPRFEPERDGPIMESELRRVVTRMTGYNCIMRVRTSTGVRIQDIYGSFSRSTPEELTFPVYDADKAIALSMERSANGSTRDFAHIQSALLYTSVEGERRVRVCNLSLPVVELAGNVFQYADQDALVGYLAKEAAVKIAAEKMGQIRENLSEDCIGPLVGYREWCSAAAPSSQLVLPDTLRTLPVMVLGILKSKVLKPHTVAPDVRSFYAHRFLTMGARSLLRHLYPQFTALHDLTPTACFPDETGRFQVPSPLRCSHYFMTADGIYLIDNEEATMLWIGVTVSPQLLLDLFGVDDIHKIDTRMHELPVLDTLFSAQVRNLLMHRQTERGRRVRFNVIDFSDMLVEDENNHNLDYPSYLTKIHKAVSNAVRPD